MPFLRVALADGKIALYRFQSPYRDAGEMMITLCITELILLHRPILTSLVEQSECERVEA
jgi:hypothetical protein